MGPFAPAAWASTAVARECATKCGHTGFAVYMALCCCQAMDYRKEWFAASDSRISGFCGYEERTIRRAISALVDAGFIAKKSGTKRQFGGRTSPNLYAILTYLSVDKKDSNTRTSLHGPRTSLQQESPTLKNTKTPKRVLVGLDKEGARTRAPLEAGASGTPIKKKSIFLPPE